MPELPEVETVVRDLRPMLVGRRIARVLRTSKVSLRTPWRGAWGPRLVGRAVTEVSRRGKWLSVRLDDGSYLLAHLGMTGQMVVAPASEPRQTHTHFVLSLNDGATELRFRDPRRFGSLEWLADEAALRARFEESGLGPEPFGVRPSYWREALLGTSRAIKAVLLDQSVVAGVGNIYADEALFRARIHPARRSTALSPREMEALRRAVEAVLTDAISRRGSTIRDYIGGSGLRGGYQDEFAVYGRGGLPCPRCGAAIISARVGGRSSHFCPACQPEGAVRTG